jgi:hypothetical protein
VELINKVALRIDALAPGAGPCRVTALDHEVLDNSMKYSFIIIAFHAKLYEILAGSWGFITPE